MRIFLFGLLMLALASCGFHLRGTGANASFAYPKAYIASTSATAQQLANTLAMLPGITLVTQAEPDAVQIEILQEGSNQQVLTLNNAGRVSEYRLYYTVNFRVRRGNEVLIGNGVISLYRDYSYDDNNVLGKTNEANTLIANMQQDAALQILRRINATANHAASASAVSAAPADAH